VPKAGHCAECNANVWLEPNGSCVNGHPAASVTGVYDPGATPYVEPAAGPNRIGRAVIIGLVAALAILGIAVFSVFVIGDRIAPDTTSAPLCYAQMDYVQACFDVYALDNTGDLPPDWNGLMETLVPEYLEAVQKCPKGGTYSCERDGGSIAITCSVHGSSDDQPVESSTP